MLASALAGSPSLWRRSIRASHRGQMERPSSSIRPPVAARQLDSVAVQASLIAAGSLAPDIIGRMARNPRLAKRYLSIEGHRALVANGDLLPPILCSLADPATAGRSDSAAASLSIASGKEALDDPPAPFGVIRAKKVLAAASRAASRWTTKRPGTSRDGRRQE